MASKKYLLMVLCLLSLSCQDNNRQQQLNLREQVVFQKEKEFSLKQAEYQRLITMRHDLLTKNDTITPHWPQDIKGIWKGQSVCKESNCPEYVIGDKRSYIWELISDSTGLYTLVSNNDNQLIRVYNAQVDNTRIKLCYVSNASARRYIEFNVELHQINQNLFAGTQTITFDNTCQAQLSLHLSRNSSFCE